MKNRTNLDERSKKYSKMLEFNANRGYETFVFASKKISQAEADSFYRSYQEALRSALNKEKNLSDIAEKLESNLTFEGAVGLFKSLKPYATETVEQSRLMGIRTHMLSGDKMDICKRAATALKMISTSSRIVDINFTDVQSGRAQLKKILESVTKQMAAKKNTATVASLGATVRNPSSNIDPDLYMSKNLVLCISGSSVEVAETNRWIHEHLKLIVEFSSTVIGYDMGCSQKAVVMGLFRDLGRKTLAVGDGYNDILMLKNASLGVQIQSLGMEYIFGDLLVSNLKALPRCLNLRGRQFNSNLSLLVEIAYQHTVMMLILNAVYQIYSAATGVPILSSGYLLLIGLLQLPLNLIFTFTAKTYQTGLRSKFPQLYSEKRPHNEQIHTKSFVWRIVSHAVVEGLFLAFLTIHSLDNQVEVGGFVLHSEQLKLILTVMIIFLYAGKLVIVSQVDKLALAVGLAVFLGVTLSLVAISQTKFDVAAINSLFTSANQLVMVLLFPISLWTVYYMVWEFDERPRIYPIGEYLNRCMYGYKTDLHEASQGPAQTQLMTEPAMAEFSRQRAVSIQSSMMGEYGVLTKQLELFESQNTEKLFAHLLSTDSFSTIYKNCFQADSEVSEQVMKLLFPNQQGSRQDEVFDRSLKFRSRSVAKKFSVYAFDKFILLSSLTLLIMCVCFAVYLLVDGVLDEGRNWDLMWTRLTIFFLVVCMYSLTFIPRFARKSGIYTLLLLGLLVVGSFFYSALTRSDYAVAGTLVLAYLSTQYVIGFRKYLACSVLTAVGLGLNYAGNYNSITEITVLNRPGGVPIFRICVLFAGLLAVYVLERYHNELLIKKEFLSGANLEGTNLFAKELLGLLLPKFILEEMENAFEFTTKPKVIDDGVNVSILFCDIADFDEVVRLQENSIIGLLDGIFKKFDDLCTIHGVQKIETVGKTYMAAAGLKKADDALPFDLVKLHPTQRILNLAKDMMAFIHEQTTLDLKIGVHVGKPVMGVIGFHKPQFSLIGDVVNTTSRHCTTGKKGRIMLSQAAWESVEFLNPLSQGYAKDVISTDMKGKGSVLVYQLYHCKKRLVQFIERIISRKGQVTDQESIYKIDKLQKLMAHVRKQKITTMNFADIVLQVKPMDTLKDAFMKLGPVSAGLQAVKQPYRSMTSRVPEHSSVVRVVCNPGNRRRVFSKITREPLSAWSKYSSFGRIGEARTRDSGY